MKTVSKSTRWLITLIILLFATSCSKEREIMRNRSENDKETSVLFLLEIPGAAHPATRSLSNADEGIVSTIDVMVFASGQYRFTQTAYNVTSISDSKKTFEVKLPLGTYDLAIIANGRSNIQAGNFLYGQAKAIVLNTLEHSLSAGIKWTSNQIPMWGARDGVTIDEHTSLTGANAIKLTRMISKIELALEAAAAGTNNDNFAITSVRLYNYNTAGKLVPDLATGWDNTGNKATAPHLPATTGKTLGPLVYTSADDPTGTFFTPSSVTNTIYTFEAAAGSVGTRLGNTCVVVGGSYKGSGSDTHFYRMDFVGIENTTSTYLSLLRNHKYTFKVRTITGPGFPTPEEAFSAGPVNIEADVIEWNEGNMNHVVFDDQFILSVSRDKFDFFRNACNSEEYDNVLFVFTDYENPVPSAVSGWYIEKIVDPATDAPVSWLTATPDHNAPNISTKVLLTYTENNTGDDRYAVIWIAAGRLRFPVHIKQNMLLPIGINIVNPADNNPINELLFTALDIIQPDAQQFKVVWTPGTAPLTIVASTFGSAPFPSGAGGPTPPSMSGTGMHTFTVQPPALTQLEIQSNPFLEKSTKYDFIISNGASLASASIFLRQVHYDLTATTESSYLLDGTQKTFFVKSNTTWKVKSIEQEVNDPTKNILALATDDNLQVGATGGYNTIGEPLTFTVTNDRSLWGKLHITFESTEYPKRFEDKTVTLIFALPEIRITGIGTTGGYGYNPAAAGTSVNCAYNMLTAANNFGLNESSTVYSKGFIFTAYGAGPTDIQVQNACNNSDIIVISYSYSSSPTQTTMLANYVKNGGVLVALWESSPSIASLLNAIFGVSSITSGSINGAGAIYQINPGVNNLVTNGPFGDLRGKQWGEDASSTSYIDITALPAGSYTLYSTGANMTNNGGNANYMTSFSLNNYNLLFVGDGGFLSSADALGDMTACPFRLDSNFAPATKNFGSATRFDVYNSAMFGNIMTWAISRIGN